MKAALASPANSGRECTAGDKDCNQDGRQVISSPVVASFATSLLHVHLMKRA